MGNILLRAIIAVKSSNSSGFPWKGHKSQAFPTSSGLAHPRQGVALRNKKMGPIKKRSSIECTNDCNADMHFFRLFAAGTGWSRYLLIAISDYGSRTSADSFEVHSAHTMYYVSVYLSTGVSKTGSPINRGLTKRFSRVSIEAGGLSCARVPWKTRFIFRGCLCCISMSH
jgi:hypothetical protein